MNLLTTAAVVMALLLLVGLLAFATTKPDTFRLQRSIGIDAPPKLVFPLINDLRAHECWNPFDAPDPATSRTHSGATEGTGAVYEWSSKGRAGSGKLSIMRSEPVSRIVMRLDMLAPFKASNEVVFTLAFANGGTELTWAMQGPVSYPAKIMHMLFNMDRMVGKQFEAGLLNLKTIVERNR
jgi:uncharacterized protein YndB with AHSA1/START domain